MSNLHWITRFLLGAVVVCLWCRICMAVTGAYEAIPPEAHLAVVVLLIILPFAGGLVIGRLLRPTPPIQLLPLSQAIYMCDKISQRSCGQKAADYDQLAIYLRELMEYRDKEVAEKLAESSRS